MKDVCVIIVAVSQMIFGLCYVLKVWRGKADATTSTWIMFLAGAGPSFFTNALANNWDLKSSVLNTTDLAYISIILIAICLWGKKSKLFDSFEKWYLFAAGLVVVYGVVSGDMRGSNWCTQILMSIAYIPMWQRIISAGKNIESFFGWLPNIFNSSVALYPAFYTGNELSAIYTFRSLSFSLITVIIMIFYEIKIRMK